MYPSPTVIRGNDALSRRKRCDAAAGACWRSACNFPPCVELPAVRGASRCACSSAPRRVRVLAPNRRTRFNLAAERADTDRCGECRGSPLCNDLDSKHFVLRVQCAFQVAASLALSPRYPSLPASRSSAEAWLVAARFRALRRGSLPRSHQTIQATTRRSRCQHAARPARPRRLCRRPRQQAAVPMRTPAGERSRPVRHSRCRAVGRLRPDVRASSQPPTATLAA